MLFKCWSTCFRLVFVVVTSSLMIGATAQDFFSFFNFSPIPSSPGAINVVSSSSASGSGGPAAASTSAQLTEGSANVSAVANSEAYSEASRIIENAVNRTFVAYRAGSETAPLIRTEAEAIGFAVADAFASTLIRADLNGTGTACGNASAQANSSATALVEAFSNAVLLSENAGPDADIEAVATATVELTVQAFAEAESTACTSGGFVEAQQESFSVAIADIFASSLAIVIDATTVAEETEVEVVEDTFAETTGAVNATGESSGSNDGTADATVAPTPEPAPAQQQNTTTPSSPPSTASVQGQTQAQSGGTQSSPSPSPAPSPPPPSPAPSPPPPSPAPSPVPSSTPPPSTRRDTQQGFFATFLPPSSSGFSFSFNNNPFFQTGRKLLRV